jgi:hypothetical protein
VLAKEVSKSPVPLVKVGQFQVWVLFPLLMLFVPVAAVKDEIGVGTVPDVFKTP